MTISRKQILAFGLTAHLLAAFFSVGYHQCDELFQVYEFAGYKLGINTEEELPWEFSERMRSGIQPMIVYGFTKALASLSVHHPFTVSFILRLLQSLLSFMVTLLFLRRMEEEIRTPRLQLWLWGASLLAWCLPYFHARFSAENFSAMLFLLGLVVVLQKGPGTGLFMFLNAGLLFGLSFVCRFQMSFMIAGLFAWLLFVKKEQLQLLAAAFLGLCLALGLGALADKWLYGSWTLSWWNYLDLNLFQDKASQFGREPLYYYIGEALLQLIPPFSLAIVCCIVAFWIRFRTHVLTWITLPFILLHFFVAHKELRFLFPVLNFLPAMLVLYAQSLQGADAKWIRFLGNRRFLRFALVVNAVALLAFVFKPADDTSHALKKIYDLVEGERPVLLYEDKDPYNNGASLHYFRNPAIVTANVNDSLVYIEPGELYYFSDKFNEGEHITKANLRFVRVYSNFPSWFAYLNFNGWLDRAGTFSIYRNAG